MCTKKTVKFGGGSVMVLGMISSKGTTALIRLDVRVNAAIYKNIIKDHVVPAIVNSGTENAVFMQDNVHNSTTTSNEQPAYNLHLSRFLLTHLRLRYAHDRAQPATDAAPASSLTPAQASPLRCQLLIYTLCHIHPNQYAYRQHTCSKNGITL
ncbi:hypothetical protein FHG87_025171 [Trinorchestia longiramus]|nr:hypothetical protein FHG87_025171 [Trinorchestia longiramus]